VTAFDLSQGGPVEETTPTPRLQSVKLGDIELGSATIDKRPNVPCPICETLTDQYKGKKQTQKRVAEVINIHESYDHTLHEDCIVRREIKSEPLVELEDF